MERLAEQLDVDAVLDTGDLTSFGLPIEARIADQVEAIDKPYLYVSGNHDSPENRRAIGAAENVTVLDGDVAEIGGVRFLGIGDPTFTATHEITGPRGEEIVAEHADEAARTVRARNADVLAVHNEKLATESFGLVPLILNGHRHERQTESDDGTLRLGLGSTGASGLGYFTMETDLPFEAQLLRFVGGCLRSQDYLRVRGIGGDVEIERRNFNLVPDPSAARPACITLEERSDDDR